MLSNFRNFKDGWDARFTAVNFGTGTGTTDAHTVEIRYVMKLLRQKKVKRDMTPTW